MDDDEKQLSLAARRKREKGQRRQRDETIPHIEETRDRSLSLLYLYLSLFLSLTSCVMVPGLIAPKAPVNKSRLQVSKSSNHQNCGL